MIEDITERMSENLLHITSYDGFALFHDLKEEQIPEISKISNKTNKKRKKDNTSELRNSAKKKTKAIQDDNNDKKYFLTSKNINNWYNSLNKVKEYINKNKKRPSIHNKDKEIQKLGRWTSL
jgi:stalled ribosome rescue protein Dom34